MTSSPLTKEDIHTLSKTFKLISDPTRLSILFFLQEEFSLTHIQLKYDVL